MCSCDCHIMTCRLAPSLLLNFLHSSLIAHSRETQKNLTSDCSKLNLNRKIKSNSCSLGTPEIGGLTSIQGIEILRGCHGLNIVGGDLVEVRNKLLKDGYWKILIF